MWAGWLVEWVVYFIITKIIKTRRGGWTVEWYCEYRVLWGWWRWCRKRKRRGRRWRRKWLAEGSLQFHFLLPFVAGEEIYSVLLPRFCFNPRPFGGRRITDVGVGGG
jgi:hypothetical protein